MSATTGARALVIGIGNAFRRDDAAGLAVARRLAADPPPGVRVLEHEGEPLELLECWTGAPEVVLVDAVRSGAAAGTVYRLEPLSRPLPARLFAGSTHALGVAEAIELGRALARLPVRLRVYGIEGAAFTAGTGLAPAVATAVDALAAELRRELGAAARP